MKESRDTLVAALRAEALTPPPRPAPEARAARDMEDRLGRLQARVRALERAVAALDEAHRAVLATRAEEARQQRRELGTAA